MLAVIMPGHYGSLQTHENHGYMGYMHMHWRRQLWGTGARARST